MTDITANVIVSMPSQLFTMARSFKAVANGKIYIGKIDTDPVNPENQIQVYIENEDGSHAPVSQPIIINAAGYPVYNGQITKFVTVQGHSMAVYDAYGAQQFYFPNVLKYDPDQLEGRLSSSIGFSYIGGVRGLVKTSEAGSLEQAIISALENNADVLVDNAQNITAPIRKSLNGRDISIISTADGWINFTSSDVDSYSTVITLDGTGTETVNTRVKMDGGKSRGVGAPITGFVINNVYGHHDSSEIRNISACVNTVNSQIHTCRGAKYYNIFQQLTSQPQSPGVYGYGTVPIGCNTVVIEGNTFGISGAPLDRHAVYCSTRGDGSDSVVNAFVSNNAVVMRDYTAETAETKFEFAFKFIDTKRVFLHDNHLAGGYGFSLITCHKSGGIESVSIHNNRARTFSVGILVGGQNEAASEPDATWYIDELKLANNYFRYRTTTTGIARGVDWRNTYRVSDVGSSYVMESSTVGLAVYYPRNDRIRSDVFRATATYYQNFQNITREGAATNTYIDITCRNAVPSTTPLNGTGATTQQVTVRSLDNSASWRTYTSSSVPGLRYFDSVLGKFITNTGPGKWQDDAGYASVGLLAGRPVSVPEGHSYWETDQNRVVVWTGSNWVLQSAGYVGIIKAGTTSQINAVNKSLLGYGHTIYNTDTKKPAFFDQLAQVWKYADGTSI
ncbi:phage head-binding domain-containing protein [Escherichia coli]|uniref:phage head-binding domain-containing protein n=1 Tax=Escherichia coli TaxID=562 RepID=UPI0020301ED7|nr:phage head-binding domain-containing protein [Escherichia coli]MDC9053597.1 phage head-binding domain-containing protein [Escherichia coli]